MIEERLGLRDKRIVVVGAGGGGIGSTICAFLDEAGVDVVGIDIDPAQGWRVADASDETSLEAALEDAGDLDGLVHVVGGLPTARWAGVVDQTAESWNEVLIRNLVTTATSLKVVARRMIAAGRTGSVVNIASIVGFDAMAYGAPYAAAKAGVMSLTRTAAIELGPHGIRVNAIGVGTIRVPQNKTRAPSTDTPETKAALPIGRRGRPEDVAGAVLYLLSDLAGFVTGTVLTVDGGATAKPSYLDGDLLPVFVPEGDLRDRLTSRDI